jgi:hypothetical protein
MATSRLHDGIAPALPVDDSSLRGRRAVEENALRPAVLGFCSLSVLIEGTAHILLHETA